MLMNAEEARKTAIGKTDERTKKGLLAAERAITQAVNAGNLDCWCGEYLTDTAIAKLRGCGYQVENCSNQRDGNMYKIIWK